MNLIKKLFGNKRTRINICLTLEIPKSDLNISEYVNFEILNCVELLEKYKYDLLKDSNLKRLEYIEIEIINSDSDILICDTRLGVDEIIRISEKIKLSKLTISQIIVPSKDKRDKQLEEGLELYRNHNRWIDFYPGQVEDVYNSFENIINELKKHFVQTETKIIEV